MKKRVHLRIYGRVQGVCFRMYTREAAERRGITGWVRNCEDGSVEVVAEGEADALSEFVRWCYTGPPHAQVQRVEEGYGPVAGDFSEFRITY